MAGSNSDTAAAQQDAQADIAAITESPAHEAQHEIMNARLTYTPEAYNAYISELENSFKDKDPILQTIQFFDSKGLGSDPQADVSNVSTGHVITGTQERPEIVLYGDGSSRGLHYDENGQIDAINETRADGSFVRLRRNEQGQWFDELTGQMQQCTEPFVDEQGNYGYYVADQTDPNSRQRITVDLSGQQRSETEPIPVQPEVDPAMMMPPGGDPMMTPSGNPSMMTVPAGVDPSMMMPPGIDPYMMMPPGVAPSMMPVDPRKV